MIRKANHNDAERITAVQLSAWKHAYSHFINPEFLASLDEEARCVRWIRLLKQQSQRVVVYHKKDNIKGFAHFNFNNETKLTELVRLYVHPDYWRKAVGRQLLEYAEADSINLGSSEIWLWVAEENQIGISFYKRNGYTLISDTRIATQFTLDGGSSPEEENLILNNLNPDKGQFSEVKYHKIL